jgi:hypothetical protein
VDYHERENMNLLEKYNNLSLNLKEEIGKFIHNEEDIFLSPSGKKIIFHQVSEALEEFEYNQLSKALDLAGFLKNEWLIIDSNINSKLENVIHPQVDFQFIRTKDHLFKSDNITFFPFSDTQVLELKSFKRDKLFLLYNGDPHPHRIMLLHELVSRNLIQHGLVSLLVKPTKEHFKHLRDKITSTKTWGEGDFYFESAPHLLDIEHPPQRPDTPLPGDGHSFKQVSDLYSGKTEITNSLDFPYKHLLDTFFSIVPETSFFPIEPNADLLLCSEKSYKALISQPFIVFARPGLLSYLHDNGFKTFPDMFDESYDEIEDDLERFNFIINQIDILCNKGYDYIKKLYLESFDNLLYNQQIFINRKNIVYADVLNNLIKEF